MCGTHLETPDHVLQCNNKRAIRNYSTARFFLGTPLEKVKTPERLSSAIKLHLSQYHKDDITLSGDRRAIKTSKWPHRLEL